MSGIQAENCCNAAGATCEDDGVEAGFAPQLHEVNHVPEAQRRVTGEHDARLTELTAEVPVDARVVLQLVGLDELRKEKKTHRNHTWSRQDRRQARNTAIEEPITFIICPAGEAEAGLTSA